MAAALATAALGVPVSVARSGSRDAAKSLVSDVSVDGGMAADEQAAASTSAAPAPSSILAEGTLPPTVPETRAVAQVRAAPAPQAPATKAPAATAAAKSAAAASAAATTTAVRRTTTTKRTAAATAAAKPAATTAAAVPRTAVKPASTTAAKKTTTTAPRPTTTPAPAPPPPAPSPDRSWTTDEVQALIRQAWPANSVDKAMDVAYRESRYRHDAYNGWCCYGVFQINASAHRNRLAARGLSVADLYDAEVNISIALELFAESGWGPWGG